METTEIQAAGKLQWKPYMRRGKRNTYAEIQKSTAEITEAADFSKQAMYTAIRNYEEGGIKALLVDKDPEQLKIKGCLMDVCLYARWASICGGGG